MANALNPVTASILEHLMTFVTSAEFMDKAKELVSEVMDLSKTGAEKRQYVYDQLVEFSKTALPGIATYLIGLAIEAAVAIVKAKIAA